MNEKPTGINLRTALIITVALIGVAYFIYHMFKTDSAKERKNPFEYNIEQYKKTDTAPTLYKEEMKISVDLARLRALAAGPGNRIYVSGDHSVKVYDSSGSPLKDIRVSRPVNCLAVDSNGDIYMGFERHVAVYQSNGQVKSVWESLGNKALVTSLALSTKHVFIADAGQFVVWRFSRDGSFLGKIGKRGRDEGDSGFIIPSPYFDVAVDPDSFLWVANPGRHKLENYYEDGGFRSSWGKHSWDIQGFCGCCNPVHFTILSNGSFVTSEKGLNRVKVYNRVGEMVGLVAVPDMFREGTTGLDLARDSQNRIYLLDPPNRQVRIFKLNSVPGGQ
jgi:hypothetical protein